MNYTTRTLLFGLLFIVSACVPILPHHDFVPQMAGGTILTDRCWGTSRVEYRTDNIALTSRIVPWPGSDLKLELRFDIPQGNTVELLVPAVNIASPPSARATPIRIPGISVTENASLPLAPMGPLIGRDLVINGNHSPGHYWLFVPLDGVVSDEMRVTLPTLKVNDRVVTIPAIDFARHVRIQLIAPLQC